MDNKKLLNFLLKDLIELDELFAEKKTGNFNTLEMEFLQTRITGARKLVQILSEREEIQLQIPEESTFTNETEKDEIPPVEEEETTAEVDHDAVLSGLIDHSDELVAEEDSVPVESEEQDELELENEDANEHPNRRISDVLLKEKSVNDSMDGDSGKLEHKLSNRPVASIQAAIGINDRFQYIRELFDGKPDDFAKTVAELDGKNSIKEAVTYLQQNFKWKKNEASLKFVNLVKRRFTHD